MNISNNSLTHMLVTTKRKQTVAGKAQSQVESCLLKVEANIASITSLTKDLTGLTHVQCGVDSGGGTFPIPDIDRVLGILALHGANVNLSYNAGKNKLVFKSGSKQTTLDSSPDALAFSHSQDTISDHTDRSMLLAERIDSMGGVYTTADGSKIQSIACYTINSTEMFEALRCDNMNGQKFNRYTFSGENKGLSVLVGDPSIGGETLTQVTVEGLSPIEPPKWEWSFDGGLDELFKQFSGPCNLHVFDFTEHGQGMRIAINFGNHSWAFQSGILA
tara:strand:- start:445 stop:1269 length:825 start_codon:yes stop_codon:yes gene_type:complete